jgi:hypothetical protein
VLDEIAERADEQAAERADRPSSVEAALQHGWTRLTEDDGTVHFECMSCSYLTATDQGTQRHPAPWPCLVAVEEHPQLRDLNDRCPVGTPVLYRPNGVGDPQYSTTRTPVWVAKDGLAYVSVEAYPPQAGAAMRIADLIIGGGL